MINKNAVAKAESMKGKINPRFSISCDQVVEIINHYASDFECGLMFFRLGYMQGMKAGLSEKERIDKV